MGRGLAVSAILTGHNGRKAPNSKSSIFGQSKQGLMEKEKPRVITAKVQLCKQATREITTADVELYGHIHHGCWGNVELMFIPSSKKQKKKSCSFLMSTKLYKGINTCVSCVGMSSVGQRFKDIVSGCHKHQSSITKAGLSCAWIIPSNGQF